MKSSTRLGIGEKGPDFNLPGVDGKSYTLGLFKDKPIVVVVFTCNHCPYAQAYETRLIGIQRDYAERGVALVAINANETTLHPEDNFPNMVARSAEKGFNFPYLRDENQLVAGAYGAQYTPEIFLLDEVRSLRYTGRIDDHWQDAETVRSHDLRDAIDRILAGKSVNIPETHAVGCTIKWAKT